MAKVYRKHRYHGIKYLIRQAGRRLVSLSRPMAYTLTIIYLVLPWLLPLGITGRGILTVIAILSGWGAYMWGRKAAKLESTMDIIAAGHDGEGVVAKVLAKLPKDWAVLNDTALRAGGPIVQFDHIVITPVGVHVLETKTQKGQIISAPETGKWQVKRRGDVRTMTNPVQQNKNQVEACRLLLKELAANLPCHGLVVMTESAATANWPLTKAAELSQYLKEHTRRSKKLLTPKEVRKLARELLSFQVRGRAPWQQGPEHWLAFALAVILPFLLFTVSLLVLGAFAK